MKGNESGPGPQTITKKRRIPMPIIFDQVDFAYDTVQVLRQVFLTLPEEGVLCLSGPSGCGKTTLLRLLAGLERPCGGRILGLAGKRPSMVFQENRLLPWMTVTDNLLSVFSHPREPERQAAGQLLEAIGLAESAEEYPASLSGGMKRRVAIARAMLYGGDILLLDEPFTGLDPALRQHIISMLLERYRGKLIVLVTHLSEEAALMGARTIPLSPPVQGGIVW